MVAPAWERIVSAAGCVRQALFSAGNKHIAPFSTNV